MTVEKAQGAVRLFRKWLNSKRLETGSGHRLASLSFRYVYQPGVNVALDLLGPESQGRIAHGPGFYGFYECKYGRANLSKFIWVPSGTILGFGRVRLNEYGAVCEKVVVESLILPSDEELERMPVGAQVAVGGLVTPKAVRAVYEQLADFYGCMLITPGVARELPGGFIEGQPVPGVRS